MLYVRTRSVHNAQRYCCMVSVACLIQRVFDLVYAVWRLASWRSECIDDRTIIVVMTGTWGVVRYTVQLIFAAVVLLIVVSMYGLCEFYVL